MDRAKGLAREWIEVWGRGDPSSLPLVANFVHVSPYGRIEGREAYLETVRPMAQANVVALQIEDVLAEADRACITYSMDTANGPVACCDWLVVADDQIASVRSYYDPRNLPSFEEY